MSSSNYYDTNEILARVVPELSSKYAKYPMKRQVWLDPSATAEDGEPAFVPHKRDPNDAFTPAVKQDYIWGTGPRGFGYYHLLTRDAYKTLYIRLQNGPKPNPCMTCCSATASKASDDFDEAKTIVYNRSVASRPDDIVAQADALKVATGEAQSDYHMSQNLQLIMMTA